MSERPYRNGGRRRPYLGWWAAATIAALFLFAHGPPVAAQVGVEPIPRGPAEPLPCRATLVDELVAGTANAFEFQVGEGDVFVLDALDISGTIELLRMRLLGTDGSVLANTCTGRIQQRATASGTYRLEVKDCIDNDAGTYSLSLNVVSDTPRNCAAPLPCGVEAEGDLDVAGQVDSYTFYGAANEPIALDLESNLDGRGGIEVRVFDPSGVAVLHTCGDTFDFNLPQTGRYTILVNTCLGKNTGVYEVSWRSRSCPTHIGAHSAGGTVGLRLSNAGTEVVQLTASNISCAFGESSGFVLDLNPPLPIVGGRFSAIVPPQDAATNAARLIDVDGVAIGDGRSQLVGGMSIRFNAARCNFQWAATSGDDLDWDGWSNNIEAALGSRSDDADSVPEDRRVGTTSRYGPGVCRDRHDNDRDNAADGLDSGCAAPLPEAPATFSSFAGRHAGGGSFAIERSPSGSSVTRLMTSSISCGGLEARAAIIDVDVPIIGNRFLATNLAFGSADGLVSLSAWVDGVFFDGDGDGTPEQALGMINLRRGQQCNIRWWASAHVDSDGDGWGDAAERRFGADPRPLPQGLGLDSTPEDERLPTSTLGDGGTCVDGIDNDGNGLTDVADPKCPPPSPTATRTPSATRTPTASPTRTATAPPSRTTTPTSPPPFTPTSFPSRTSTATIAPTTTPTMAPPPTDTAVQPTDTPRATASATHPPPTPTAPSATHTATPVSPTSAPASPTSTPVPPTKTPVSPTNTPISPTLVPTASASPTAPPTTPPATTPPIATPSRLACNGEGPIRAVRSVPERFRAGGRVEVRLDIEVDESAPLRSARIVEQSPAGWVLKDYDTVPLSAVTPLSWGFVAAQITDRGMDVRYDVEAPKGVASATFCGAVHYENVDGAAGCFFIGCDIVRGCQGDCNADGVVSIDEVLLQVRISLGDAMTKECRAGDTDGNRMITVDEMLSTVSTALSGCPG